MDQLGSFALALSPYLAVTMCLIFVAIVAWAYAPRQRKSLEDAGQIPFRDQAPR